MLWVCNMSGGFYPLCITSLKGTVCLQPIALLPLIRLHLRATSETEWLHDRDVLQQDRARGVARVQGSGEKQKWEQNRRGYFWGTHSDDRNKKRGVFFYLCVWLEKCSHRNKNERKDRKVNLNKFYILYTSSNQRRILFYVGLPPETHSHKVQRLQTKWGKPQGLK